MTEDLVEFVARALVRSDGLDPDYQIYVRRVSTPMWKLERYQDGALAALGAIEGAGYKVVGRTPTDKMITAMNDTGPGSVWANLEVYKAAFDAAPAFGGE